MESGDCIVIDAGSASVKASRGACCDNLGSQSYTCEKRSKPKDTCSELCANTTPFHILEFSETGSARSRDDRKPREREGSEESTSPHGTRRKSAPRRGKRQVVVVCRKGNSRYSRRKNGWRLSHGARERETGRASLTSPTSRRPATLARTRAKPGARCENRKAVIFRTQPGRSDPSTVSRGRAPEPRDRERDRERESARGLSLSLVSIRSRNVAGFLKSAPCDYRLSLSLSLSGERRASCVVREREKEPLFFFSCTFSRKPQSAICVSCRPARRRERRRRGRRRGRRRTGWAAPGVRRVSLRALSAAQRPTTGRDLRFVIRNSVVSGPIWILESSNDSHGPCHYRILSTVLARHRLSQSQTPNGILNRSCG